MRKSFAATHYSEEELVGNAVSGAPVFIATTKTTTITG